MRSTIVSILLTFAALTSGEKYVQYAAVTQSTTMPQGRALASAVLQHTVASTAALGRYIWVFGGMDATLGALNDLWRLDMQTNTWAAQAPYGVPPSARRGAAMVLSEQRTAYLFGGETTTVRLNDLFLLHCGGGLGARQPAWRLHAGQRHAARTRTRSTRLERKGEGRNCSHRYHPLANSVDTSINTRLTLPSTHDCGFGSIRLLYLCVRARGP